MRKLVLAVGCVALVCGTLVVCAGTLANGLADDRYLAGDTVQFGWVITCGSLGIILLEIVGVLGRIASRISGESASPETVADPPRAAPAI
jgi:hypothetical protein